MEHWEKQKKQSDKVYARGSREHVTSADSLTQYIVRWRLIEAVKKITESAVGRVNKSSSFLVVCSGEGMEGSILCDMGYENVTVSDISGAGVRESLRRDNRLTGMVLNAEHIDMPNSSYDVVVVQDGLHHLRSPVRGFTEMLRVARVGVIVLEPNNSLAGKLIGTKWEVNGDAINYVFRWSRDLIEDISSSYLGMNSFKNNSFSFWHHNIVYSKIGIFFGGGGFSIRLLSLFKRILDGFFSGIGNAFCGIIVKN